MFGRLMEAFKPIGKYGNVTLKEQLEIEENAVTNLPLMNSPWPILIILASYLYFVLKIGPKYMANRKAYNLKGFMLMYNLLQVLYNGFFVEWMINSGIIPFLIRQSCYPDPHADVSNRLEFLRGAWVWFVLKVIDLMDTVIFILRKKQSQVSFLHVYHHTIVVLSCWLHIKYCRGEQSVAIGFVNSIVHAIMYMYYLLAAMGPSVQPYLWWKRHITKLQMKNGKYNHKILYSPDETVVAELHWWYIYWIVENFHRFKVQFVAIFGWFSYLTLGCHVPIEHKVYNWFSISQAITFFILFASFYFNSYRNKRAKSN